jgi:hypothetical protein
MEEHTDEPKTVFPCRTAPWCFAALMLVCLSLHTVVADAKGLRRYFDLEAGDTSAMLNEFSRQSDLQVFFDFDMGNGMRIAALNSEFDTSTGLKTMSDGTNLVFEFRE